jgi:ATP-dependent Zn protease
LAPDVNLEAIARSTEGLTGADLKALLYTAQLGKSRVPQRNIIYSEHTL